MKGINLTDIDIETAEQIFHSSFTIFSNEFTVFLGYHNRELMTSLCDWYDCPNRWVYDTITRDKEIVIGCWVNILGGTTPDNIQESLPVSAIGGGLISRIIFVNEQKRDKLVIFHSSTQRDIDLQQHLVHDLEQISLMSGSYRFTEDAVRMYTEWCHLAAADPPFHDAKFDGYCGRRRNHLLSLAMVCSASRDDSLVLKAEDIMRSAEILTEVEVKMGTVFRGIGRSDISALINDAIIFIENSATPNIPVWQFARHFEGHMDKFSMDRVLTTLEVSNHIKMVRRPGVDNMIVILDRLKNEQTDGDKK